MLFFHQTLLCWTHSPKFTHVKSREPWKLSSGTFLEINLDNFRKSKIFGVFVNTWFYIEYIWFKLLSISICSWMKHPYFDSNNSLFREFYKQIVRTFFLPDKNNLFACLHNTTSIQHWMWQENDSAQPTTANHNHNNLKAFNNINNKNYNN